jgi:hypothetical protein
VRFQRNYKPGYFRLADNYFPDSKKIKPNKIYQYFQEYIENALRSPGDWSSEKEAIEKDKFEYHLNDDEILFYQKLYVPSKLLVIRSGRKFEEFFNTKSQKQLNIGRIEWDLINSIFLKENKLIVLVAPIGWGKTVLLKHTWLYLINQSEILTQRVIPAYISLDQRDLFFNHGPLEEIKRILNQQYLVPRLLNISFNFASIEDEEFWDYLINSNVCFISIKKEIEDLEYYLSDSPTELKQEVARLRSEIRKHERYPYYATKYVIDKKDKRVVIIFDNVDLFPINVQKVILGIATELIEDYGIQCIISLRDDAFYELSSHANSRLSTFPRKIISLEQLDVQAYLEKRVKAAFRDINSEFEFEYDKKRYSHPDPLNVIMKLLRILFSRKEYSDFLAFISFHNLRLLNDFLRLYLSTGYIEQQNVVSELMKMLADASSGYSSPLYVLLASVLTANHQTYFSSPCQESYLLRRILNVFFNSKGDVNPYIIRWHLLNFLKRNPQTSVENIHRKFQKLYEKREREEDRVSIDEFEVNKITVSLNHALDRFFECNLVISPEKYKLEQNREDDVIAIVHNIEFTDTGNYYYDTLMGYFEYLIFMKDDVVLPIELEIKDCVVEQNWKRAYQNELIKFLQFLVEMEWQFFITLECDQRKLFVDEFTRVNTGNIYNTYYLIEKMIEYGNSRHLDVSEYESMRNDLDVKNKFFATEIGESN